jgi:uncharacterized damage-inducible protein DinB
VSAARKITEAENILFKLQKLSDKELQTELDNFLKTISDVFLHLLDEYNKKFELKMDRVGFEKFKSKARKTRNLDAINFLIWYEKEYKKIKNDTEIGYLLEKERPSADKNTLYACSVLLNRTRELAYYAYEHF